MIETSMNQDELATRIANHAQEHYEDGGWDVIVECWSHQEIVDYLVQYGGIKTFEDALKAFQSVIGVWADQQADARNSAW